MEAEGAVAVQIEQSKQNGYIHSLPARLPQFQSQLWTA